MLINQSRREPSIVDKILDSTPSVFSALVEKKPRQNTLSRIAPVYSNRAKALWISQKLSGKIAILLYLHRRGDLPQKSQEVFLDLLSKAPLSALEQVPEKCSRLEEDDRYYSSLILEIRYALTLRRAPAPKLPEARRIAVGYRDKGTCPDNSSKAQRKAVEESWIDLRDTHLVLAGFLQDEFPQAVEGHLFDLSFLERVGEKEPPRSE